LVPFDFSLYEIHTIADICQVRFGGNVPTENWLYEMKGAKIPIAIIIAIFASWQRI
jgi:hypothetical protein